jgi:hypothetical protein
MKRQRKKVKVCCHGPLGVGKQYKSPWEDIWIYYKIRPGKSHHFWFTFISYPDFRRGAAFNIECARDSTDADFSEEIAYDERIEKYLETNDFHFNETQGDFVVRQNYIDREVVENLLDWYMKSKGYNDVKYKWKYPNIVVLPFSFAKMEDE